MKMKYTMPAIFTCLSFSLALQAQEPFYYDEKTGEEYRITSQTEKGNLNKYLEKNKLKEIEFNPDSTSKYSFRVKTKRGDWLLSDVRNLEMYGQRKYTLEFPDQKLGTAGFTTATRKGKKYFYSFSETKVYDFWFDELKIRTRSDRVDTSDNDPWGMGDEESTTEPEEEVFEEYDGVILKRENKYALAHCENGAFYLLSGFHFESEKELPAFDQFYYYEDLGTPPYFYPEIVYKSDEMRAVHNELRNYPDWDIVIPLGYSELNESIILKARHHETKRWTIRLESFHLQSQTLPVAASKITRHDEWDTPVYEVWCEGKVGFYNHTFQKYLPCEYDDFKYVHLDYTSGCALKKNGQWELFSSEEATKSVDGNAETLEELMELWWNR